MKSLKYSVDDKLIYLENSGLYLEVNNETNSFDVNLNDFSQIDLLNPCTMVIGIHLIDFGQKDNIIIKTICKDKDSIKKYKDIITREYIITDGNTSLISPFKEFDLEKLSSLFNYTFNYVINTIDFSLQEFISMKNFICEFKKSDINDYTDLYISDEKLLSKLKAIREISMAGHFNLLMQFLLSKVESLKDTVCFDNFIRNLDIACRNVKCTIYLQISNTEDYKKYAKDTPTDCKSNGVDPKEKTLTTDDIFTIKEDEKRHSITEDSNLAEVEYEYEEDEYEFDDEDE